MNEVADCPVQDWGSEELCFPPGNVVGGLRTVGDFREAYPGGVWEGLPQRID